MIAWLGSRPDQFCSPPTARAMAVVAFDRARRYGAAPELAIGLSCTAGLVTDRPKRGPHRAHVALQTMTRTATWSLDLLKDRRSRAEEERLTAHLILNALADATGVAERLDLPLLDDEKVEHAETRAPTAWQDLLLGRVEVVCGRGESETGRAEGPPRAILSGAFNPLHEGHRRMAEAGQALLGIPVAMEISITNVDKPPLDYHEIARRLGQFPPGQTVCLSRAATFEEKSRLYPGATFLVGVDTLRRIASPRYYPGDATAYLRALERIANRRCRFLVFGRDMGTGFVRISDLELPGVLQAICQEVPPERFREDISSTSLRRAGAW